MKGVAILISVISSTVKVKISDSFMGCHSAIAKLRWRRRAGQNFKSWVAVKESFDHFHSSAAVAASFFVEASAV